MAKILSSAGALLVVVVVVVVVLVVVFSTILATEHCNVSAAPVIRQLDGKFLWCKYHTAPVFHTSWQLLEKDVRLARAYQQN